MIPADAVDSAITLPWRRALAWLPAILVRRRCYYGPDGTLVRALDDGSLEITRPGGHPRAGIAADPAPGRRQP